MNVRAEHDAERSRFVLYSDTEVAAVSEYFDVGDTRNFFHTVTLPQYRGRGYAAVLTEYALNDTRSHELFVQPSCWFVHEFIETNADNFGDLLTSPGSPGER